MKIAKNLFKKAHKDAKDPWLALLDYRNTPTEGAQPMSAFDVPQNKNPPASGNQPFVS